MAEKNNAYCTICGKPYYVCMSCQDSMRLSPWKIHTDTAEHFKVSQIVHGISTNVYTKDEARTKLKNVNLEDMDTFRPHIKKIIEDILKEEKPVVKAVKKAEPIVEIEPVIEEVTEVVVNTVVESAVGANKTESVEYAVKPIVSRKRNYKVDNETEKAE